MPNQQYHTLVTQQNKAILKNIHAHPLLRPFAFGNVEEQNNFNDQAWANYPEQSEWLFGGLHGTQFTSQQDALSFNAAFDDLLGRKGIAEMHRGALLYMISFYDLGIEKQAKQNNKHNKLNEYARFLIDLVHNCYSYVNKLEKNQEYKKFYHQVDISVRHLPDEIKYPDGKSFYFLKKTVCEQLNYDLDALEDYYPDKDKLDELIWFRNIQFYNNKLPIPQHIMVSIRSNEVLKTVMGEVTSSLDIPPIFQSDLLTFIIKYMLDYHKKNKTTFYKIFSKPDTSLQDMKEQYSKYQKKLISNTYNTVRVGKLIEDYLLEHTALKYKTQTADFLFEYFAMLNLLPLSDKKREAQEKKLEIERPIDYLLLVDYYKAMGITKDTVRLMMKDVNDILGEI